METKFTKGEWKIFWGNYTHAATINQDVMHRICTIEAGENHAKEWEANAKLIAAAPDLLESLNDLVNKLSPYIYKMGVKKGFSELLSLENAKKAIKKATE
jgi:hypothetical protein